jgi:lysophospholipase L1-like esterase
MTAWTSRSLVLLGDSTAVGLGDPVPGGAWRGVGPLLADALGSLLTNLSRTGARIDCLRRTQLPQALRANPDVAVLIAGMNDTLRSDFDPVRIRADLSAVVGSLRRAGAVVLVVRYHDHGKVFRLPRALHRALRSRIDRLNDVVDSVVVEHGAACLDLDLLPGAYQVASWSVDRLHPSELGHRMLANGFATLLAERGCAVPEPVSPRCSGGIQPGAAAHVAWLVLKGIPWLWRRGRDLVPYAAGIMLRSLLRPSPRKLSDGKLRRLVPQRRSSARWFASRAPLTPALD